MQFASLVFRDARYKRLVFLLLISTVPCKTLGLQYVNLIDWMMRLNLSFLVVHFNTKLHGHKVCLVWSGHYNGTFCFHTYKIETKEKMHFWSLIIECTTIHKDLTSWFIWGDKESCGFPSYIVMIFYSKCIYMLLPRIEQNMFLSVWFL